MLEGNQVDGQCSQVRADGQRRIRHPGRAGRSMLAAAFTQSPVPVVPVPLRGRLGDLRPLE
jgi:hypothetical protein